MSIFFWNLIAMIGGLLIAFPIAAIYNYKKSGRLSTRKLKIQVLLIMLGIVFIIMSTYELGILDRLVVAALCLSLLILLGLIVLSSLFRELKKQ